MTISQFSVIGDSLSMGTIEAFSNTQGGKGGWVELVAERLGALSAGPLLSPGVRLVGLGRNSFPVEWTYTTGGDAWTAVAPATDAFDVLPYGYGAIASGATKIATWTVPSKGYAPIVGFDIWWVDYASGGNWSYSVDGGSTWIANGQSRQNDNKLCKFYVATALVSGGTVKFRGADTSGTAAGCFPAGITPYFADPRSATSGVIFNNYAINGQTLHNFVTKGAGNGDRMSCLDNVRLGTGSPISSVPNKGVLMMHINDVQSANSTQWGTDLTALNTRASPLAPLFLLNCWEVETTDYNQTQQTNYRAQTKTSAAGFSPAATVYDFYDQWSLMGYTGNAQSIPFLASDSGLYLHPNQAGNLDIANRVYWLLRNAGGYTGPSTYVSNAKQASVAALGKVPSIVAAASMPISPILQ